MRTPRLAPLLLALSLAACGGASSPAATASKGVGGVCGEHTADECLNAAANMFEVDKDAANVFAEYLCTGDFGGVTRDACTISGHVYRMGGVEVKKDPATALARYEKGCPLAAADAQAGSCFRVGLAHAKGALTLGQPATLPIDKDQGKRYLDLACGKGFAEACTVAGQL